MVEVRALSRDEAVAHFDDLARLRIEVFRQWPYLYDGDLDYERAYLQTYFASQNAFIAGAFADGRLVGACTASPLQDHAAEFAEPFRQAKRDLRDHFYFGESVLLAPYRGQGIGDQFLRVREEEARHQGFNTCIFAAVERPQDHPMRPPEYTPLDGFWRKRGYAPIPGFETQFSWRDIGETQETAKPMRFWSKDLT
ncbi:MAG: GNAT family N-acetyltransferase [Pseudomonadota bacterium]